MRKQIVDLREKMKEHNIDAYYIPTTDPHESEYVHDRFKCREFLSGFTGSAGTMVVTMDEARLWTDGRYFLQAERQLEGSGIKLMKMGEPGIPTILEYLTDILDENQILGFDGRVCSNGKFFSERFNISSDHDLVGEIWDDRPAIKPSEIYHLDSSVTGRSAADKMDCIRSFISSSAGDYHIISNLEQIAWLYNLRGNDIKHTPVFYAYAIITPDEDRLYVMDKSFIEKVSGSLSTVDGYAPGNTVLPYEQFYDDIRKLPAGRMLLDEKKTNYGIIKAISPDMEIVTGEDPASIFKSIKTPVEILSTKEAHLKDGTAMVNFLYWLKNNMDKAEISEMSAADHLDKMRYQQGAYDLSFDTISAYAENGAVIHYTATTETNKILKSEGLYLVDSGGQYPDGTTDITRTVVLGPVTYEMKEHYTAVLKGHIALSTAQFKPGISGASLDAAARRPLTDIGLNYNHGTGHGVGHMLCCHEGPQSISPRGTSYAIEPGMINSNEPGVYIEGSHGIRLENEILCIELENGMYGFEPITFCPFDRSAVITENLTDAELEWLNSYHRQVYEKIGPRVDDHVREWLKKETAEIIRK